MGKQLLFSVTRKEFDIQFFRSGGKGGQNQNKRSTGCRIRHPNSGAVGECRNFRTQLQNKKTAFHRLADSKKFRLWLRVETAKRLQGYRETEQRIKAAVEAAMHSDNIKVEYI